MNKFASATPQDPLPSSFIDTTRHVVNDGSLSFLQRAYVGISSFIATASLILIAPAVSEIVASLKTTSVVDTILNSMSETSFIFLAGVTLAGVASIARISNRERK